MTAATRWTTFLVLPFVALFEIAGYYANRSVLVLLAVEGGMAREEVGTLLTATTSASMIATFLSAIVAIGTGPWIPVALACLGAAFGCAALGVFPAEAMFLPAVLVAFSHGFARPAIYGAAAQAFRAQRSHLRDSLFLCLWMAGNLAGLASVRISTSVGSAFGASHVVFLAAGLACIAFVAATGATIVSFVSRDKSAKKPAFAGARVGAAFGVAAVGAVALCGYSLVMDVFSQAAFEVSPPGEPGWLELVNPMIVVALTGLLAIVFGILHLTRVRMPALAIAGAGALLVGAGGILTMLVTDPATVGGLVLAAFVVSIGEALFVPLLLSRISGDLPMRLETAAAAVFLILGQLPLVILNLVRDEPSAARGIAWAGSFATILVGAVLVVAAFALRRVFAPPEEKAEEPPLPSAASGS